MLDDSYNEDVGLNVRYIFRVRIYCCKDQTYHWRNSVRWSSVLKDLRTHKNSIFYYLDWSKWSRMCCNLFVTHVVSCKIICSFRDNFSSFIDFELYLLSKTKRSTTQHHLEYNICKYIMFIGKKIDLWTLSMFFRRFSLFCESYLTLSSLIDTFEIVMINQKDLFVFYDVRHDPHFKEDILLSDTQRLIFFFFSSELFFYWMSSVSIRILIIFIVSYRIIFL